MINSYIEKIDQRYRLGNATEHTFRGDLQHLVESLVPEIRATNEPKRIECGAPDYVITRKEIPVGYIEAKDVGVDLGSKQLKEQLDRYREALDNLLYTDYLEFRLYLNGELKTSIRIGEIKNGRIVAIPGNFEQFENLVKDFCSRTPQTIKSSKKLAEMMADKAKILAFIIKNALDEDVQSEENSTLRDQMQAFKSILIHDIDSKAFADIYAQTIAYGMFAARLHDHSLETFTRREAAELIPKTNPFLRKLFQYIAGFDLDTRIDWIVDALADLFRATDIAAILKNFGKSTQTHDPIMHFYETFLAEYDPKLRKSRGVFYTPEPVVDFIVRAVDDILKTEFNLPNGIADTSKTKIKYATTVKDNRTASGYREDEKDVHKVQILDPATGTGTFLASVIKHIYKGFENQQGVWNQYVDEHLIPRLNGFELLMASYAMAHLKLDLLLSDTGYKSEPGATAASSTSRFQVYLTNALEEYHPDTGTLFANWLSTEANEANHIKRDTPVMVVIGNPPYSMSSSNKSAWIESLTSDYKKGLNERNVNPLSDDYIKFFRFGQHFVEKNGEGVLAYISNNGFLDGVIHRQMRQSLLLGFDSIYVVNLHGNTNLKEVNPDGGPDENVFDIRQGVSINIFVKTGQKRAQDYARVLSADLWGSRRAKYEILSEATLANITWTTLNIDSQNMFFVPKDFSNERDYEGGLRISDLFIVHSNGFTSEKDSVAIQFDRSSIEFVVKDLKELSIDQFKSKHNNIEDGGEWTVAGAKEDVENAESNYIDVLYRPMDVRKTFYTGKTKGLFARPRFEVMQHLLHSDNVALIVPKQNKESLGGFITQRVSGHKTFSAYDKNSVFPLYTYSVKSLQQSLDSEPDRTPNLRADIVAKFEAALELSFTLEKERVVRTFAPIDILDYIYAVLHSPTYREKYKEFLKIDFPRVPYPKDAATFWQLVTLGGELRQIHLLESPTVSKFITGFPVGGDNSVVKPEYKDGNVHINPSQHFSGVPETAWNFYIGGYQPAQKWLKDRKGRTLNYEDVLHYQKIIVALAETEKIMSKIDEIPLVD